jgi:hypothetical protein
MAEFRTRDVSLAAFFRFKGHDLIRYDLVKDKNTTRTEGEWVFALTREEASALKVDYVNSDIAAFEGIRRGMAKQKYG